MNLAEIGELTEAAQEHLRQELGDQKFFGVVAGTGWKQGLARHFHQREEIPYDDLNVPQSGASLGGHTKSLKIGEIDGHDVAIMGRVHANEAGRHSELPQAMRVVLGGMKENMNGLLVTNGVGSLHGELPAPNRLSSLIQTAAMDVIARLNRGRGKEEVRVEDVVIVDDMITTSVGSYTPLVGGEFLDWHAAMHAENDRYFKLVREAVEAVQGKCARAVYAYMPGPQFEGPTQKRNLRMMGGDVVGMSAVQENLIAAEQKTPFANIGFVTNGAFVKHSHKDNTDIGLKNADKLGNILREIVNRWQSVV